MLDIYRESDAGAKAREPDYPDYAISIVPVCIHAASMVLQEDSSNI